MQWIEGSWAGNMKLAGRRFDAYLSSNRTCEIGMSRATGRDYESVINALDRATRP